jgi:hypothetical protein
MVILPAIFGGGRERRPGKKDMRVLYCCFSPLFHIFGSDIAGANPGLDLRLRGGCVIHRFKSNILVPLNLAALD